MSSFAPLRKKLENIHKEEQAFKYDIMSTYRRIYPYVQKHNGCN